jgi:hypothetical protein
MTPTGAPTVFVIDDDDLVRESIQGLLKSAGLRSESFASPQDFLSGKRPDGPSCRQPIHASDSVRMAMGTSLYSPFIVVLFISFSPIQF